jgi:hypothetical protein
MSGKDPVQVRGLVDVLLTISRQNGTGILTVQNEDGTVGITFKAGEVVSADSLNESEAEGLGKILQDKGLVLRKELDDLAAEQEQGGGRVIDLLVNRHLLERDQLLEILRLRFFELSQQVLTWSSGEFRFYRVEDVAFEKGIRPLSVEELLIRSAEDLGSSGPLPGRVPTPQSIYSRVDESEGSKLIAPGAPFELDLEEGSEVLDLLHWLNGERSAAEVSIESGIPQYKVLFDTYVLQQGGRAVVVDHDTAEYLTHGSSPWLGGMDGGEPRKSKLSEIKAKAGQWWSERVDDVQAKDERLWIRPNRVLGVGLIVALVAVLLIDPGRYMLPFPWQGGLRQALLDEQTSAAYLKLDRAAKTWFLLEGQFPEQLSELASYGSLVASDMVDPAGRPLGYAAQIASYLVYPLGEGDPAPGSSRTEPITGDFLLDPEFITPPTEPVTPLVLIE